MCFALDMRFAQEREFISYRKRTPWAYIERAESVYRICAANISTKNILDWNKITYLGRGVFIVSCHALGNNTFFEAFVNSEIWTKKVFFSPHNSIWLSIASWYHIVKRAENYTFCFQISYGGRWEPCTQFPLSFSYFFLLPNYCVCKRISLTGFSLCAAIRGEGLGMLCIFLLFFGVFKHPQWEIGAHCSMLKQPHRYERS